MYVCILVECVSEAPSKQTSYAMSHSLPLKTQEIMTSSAVQLRFLLSSFERPPKTYGMAEFITDVFATLLSIVIAFSHKKHIGVCAKWKPQ